MLRGLKGGGVGVEVGRSVRVTANVKPAAGGDGASDSADFVPTRVSDQR